MNPGTVVKLPDGRIGTVVYHHLDGYGIRFGDLKLSEDEVDALLRGEAGEDYAPEAMLRDPYPSADYPCVGEQYEVIE